MVLLITKPHMILPKPSHLLAKVLGKEERSHEKEVKLHD